VHAYHHTYGLPTVTTNCSNNYGPYQFPEKLVPLMVLNCIEGKPLPVYGNGGNVRDWLYVEDHCEAIRLALDHGRLVRRSVWWRTEKTNLEMVHTICDLVDELSGKLGERPARLVTFVTDRPDTPRYSVDSTRAETELGWKRRAGSRRASAGRSDGISIIRAGVRTSRRNGISVNDSASGESHEGLVLAGAPGTRLQAADVHGRKAASCR